MVAGIRAVKTFGWVIILMIASQIMSPQNMGVTHAQGPDAELPLQHLVLEVSAGVTIQRALPGGGLTDEIPLTVGQLVSSDDTIRTDVGQNATILCADNRTDTLISGSNRKVCTESTVRTIIFTWDGVKVIGPLRSANRLHIISPRNSVILNQLPDFILSDVPEPGTRYIVELINRDTLNSLWKGPVTGRIIRYPLSVPLFAADPNTSSRLRYQLNLYQVDSQGRERLISDPQGNDGFCVIRGDQRPLVEQGLDVRANLPVNLSADAKRYASAVFLYSQGLYLDTRNELLNLLPNTDTSILFQSLNPTNISTNNLSDSPMLYMLLARTTYNLRLQGESEAAYKRAGELAELLGDAMLVGRVYEELADIQRGGLPIIRSDATGVEGQVYDYYMKAQLAYTIIGDVISAERISRKLTQPPVISPPDDFCQ